MDILKLLAALGHPCAVVNVGGPEAEPFAVRICDDALRRILADDGREWSVLERTAAALLFKYRLDADMTTRKHALDLAVALLARKEHPVLLTHLRFHFPTEVSVAELMLDEARHAVFLDRIAKLDAWVRAHAGTAARGEG